MDNLSLQEQKDTIRKALLEMGTDCNDNDADLTGNGDQSMIPTVSGRDAARNLYSIGGDINIHARQGALSPFAMMCITGNLEAVHDKILEVTSMNYTDNDINSTALKTLLETRETSLRLSPLLLIVSIGKTLIGPDQCKTNFQGVTKLLLKHGAAPDAKDVLGKTVCHYGAGAMATSMTLEVADMCIRAAGSSHLFDKQVELNGLKNQGMNGKKGVVGGFDAGTGRRKVIFVAEEGREVWVKPENLKLCVSSPVPIKTSKIPILTDVQDRMKLSCEIT
jgi:hypothetical protein